MKKKTKKRVIGDISEIIHVGDFFTHSESTSIDDGYTIDVYYQVFRVDKKNKSVLVAEVYVPDNYDFSQIYFFNTSIVSSNKPFFYKKVKIGKNGQLCIYDRGFFSYLIKVS